MRTAVYLRVSSKSQTEASQLPDLERWVKAQSEDFAASWHRDTFTGRTMDRPGWGKLWADVLVGHVGRVVVWRLDRLGRTARELTALFDELLTRGVTLVSLREGFDLSTPGGRLFAHLLASVAQYETEVHPSGSFRALPRLRPGASGSAARKGKAAGRAHGSRSPTTRRR